jgi:N-methylhydantoinase A
LQQIAGSSHKQLVHGSTVATNAILERKGVRTAFIANKGFEDILEIGRQNRTRLYDLAYRKEPGIVSADCRFGVRGRILSSGKIWEDQTQEDLAEILACVMESKTESVAVCLLFSYLNPAHEKILGALLKDLGVEVSLSHEILSEFREYERASTTVVNAYVSPKVKRYISHLSCSLQADEALRIMQSNGGSISAETAMHESVRTILSGPAGGAVGALEMGKLAGYTKLIAFDMGGTSTDVSLIDGTLSLTSESNVAGYPLKVPMIDIHTVGAGGGSIASIDSGGSLRVGPESAGAEPGPICYGQGNQITVTDANLLLGRLVPEYFLGGQLKLKPSRLDRYFEDMSGKTGLSKLELAEGILSVANTAMERAIRVISVERGYDPGEFTLFAFGGAGAMHAAFLARILEIPRVLVPRNPGILSAMGMVMADIIKDYSQTIMLLQSASGGNELLDLFSSLRSKAKEELAREGVGERPIVFEEYLDMRYQGQSYEIIVPFDQSYADNFHLLHEQKYGYRNPTGNLEIVNVRLRARSVPQKPVISEINRGSEEIGADARLGVREVIFDSVPVKTKIVDREKLLSGNRIAGAAILVEYSSTIVVPPWAEAVVDAYGNLIMQFATDC